MKKKILYWTPRVICLLAILFVMSFSFDVFEPGLSRGQQFLGFFMHNIPTLVLIAFLVISWKWEFIGGIIFSTVAVFGMIYLTDAFTRNLGSLYLSVPFLIVGGLFFWYHFLYKNGRSGRESKEPPRDLNRAFEDEGEE